MPVTEKKKNAYYQLSIRVLLHPKLGSYDLEFGFIQNQGLKIF